MLFQGSMKIGQRGEHICNLEKYVDKSRVNKH